MYVSNIRIWLWYRISFLSLKLTMKVGKVKIIICKTGSIYFCQDLKMFFSTNKSEDFIFQVENYWKFIIKTKFSSIVMARWLVGGSFLRVWMWVSASQRILLSALSWNLHKGLPTRPEEDEERQGLRAVNRRKELSTVRERRRSEKGGCWARSWALWGPEARSASARGWVSTPGSCVRIFVRVHARDRHRSTEC